MRLVFIVICILMIGIARGYCYHVWDVIEISHGFVLGTLRKLYIHGKRKEVIIKIVNRYMILEMKLIL